MSHQPNTTCIKCGGTTEFGIIADTRDYRTPLSPLNAPEKVAEWIRGMPNRSAIDLSFKVPPEDRLQIASLRCTRCGFLELYAPEPQ